MTVITFRSFVNFREDLWINHFYSDANENNGIFPVSSRGENKTTSISWRSRPITVNTSVTIVPCQRRAVRPGPLWEAPTSDVPRRSVCLKVSCAARPARKTSQARARPCRRLERGNPSIFLVNAKIALWYAQNFVTVRERRNPPRIRLAPWTANESMYPLVSERNKPDTRVQSRRHRRAKADFSSST